MARGRPEKEKFVKTQQIQFTSKDKVMADMVMDL